MEQRTAAVSVRNVTKRFGPVLANDKVCLDIYRGEILALLGENGSGKTTLMNMLSGIYYPDEGEIYINGKPVSISSPKESFHLGIGMIHQHFKLVDVFTAAENIILGLDEKLGSQVSVDLTINGEYEANGMNIWVQYDAEKLTLNSVDEGEIMKAIKDLGGMNILDFQSIPGSVRLGSMLPTDPVSGSGKIFTMNFTVAEGLEDGTEMPIEILVKEFFNMPVGGENTPIAFFAENGSIVVGEAPVTEAPITDEPTAVPTDAPNPPITGAMSLIGVGIAAIVASAGVVIFRKKEED